MQLRSPSATAAAAQRPAVLPSLGRAGGPLGMGIVPLQFRAGETADTHGLTGRERYDVAGLGSLLAKGLSRGSEVTVRARDDSGATREFRAIVRIDTPQEARYFAHGGILPYVLRRLLGSADR